MCQRPFLLLFFFIVLSILSACKSKQSAIQDASKASFQSDWAAEIDRPWAGAKYWLNPLQAWRQKEGELRCEVSGGDRNCVLLTKSLDTKFEQFQMQVNIRKLDELDKSSADIKDEGWVGFQIGRRGRFKDYRDDAVHGRGFGLGLTKQGELFIGAPAGDPVLTNTPNAFKLQLLSQRLADGMYRLTLSCISDSGRLLRTVSAKIHPTWLDGLVALSCSNSPPPVLELEKSRGAYVDLPSADTQLGGNTHFAFRDWQLSGDMVQSFPERSFGPILWTQYTLSDQTLYLSAQFAPLTEGYHKALLEVDGLVVKEGIVDPNSLNALFRIDNWDDRKDHVFAVNFTDEQGQAHRYTGLIRKNPTDQDKLVVASLSCSDDVGFPHQDIVANVLDHRPDLLSFHGDQIYERVGGYGVERSSRLDYLRKWYIWGWAFRELLKNQPAVIIPDDHDVFHGNLWGCGGKKADVSQGFGDEAQDDGGYKEPPAFVNMVHRTQSGHLPTPFDARPVLNDISVYYTNLNYGQVSFAILADRQWKSAPKALFPDAAIDNGWPQNLEWNPKKEAFHPDAQLLGERQMDFLKQWVRDWDEGIAFKAVISQTPFCNIATLPKDIHHDRHVPKLKRYAKGDYPPDDRPVADFDSNGWPKDKRDEALRVIRKAFAVHLTGDQHLGSTGQYGIEDWGDAGYWISSPAISNIWPRRWYPQAAPEGGLVSGKPRYYGRYEDGFGNKINVEAIANPHDIDRYPSNLYDKAPGYSILVFDKPERKIQLAVWPRWAAPNRPAPDNRAFDGWPVTIAQSDNYGRAAVGYLPEISLQKEDYIELIRQSDSALVYAIRPGKASFRPKVFELEELYTLRIVSAEGKVKEQKNLKAQP
ncbi:MAG: alkaline phosphatase D family protein [Bacteroidota bacterium]